MSLAWEGAVSEGFFRDNWTLAQSRSGHPAQPAPAEIADDFPCGVMSRGAGNPAARMGAGATHVQPVHRPAIVAITQHGTGGKHLVESQGAMKDVTAYQSEGAFQIQRALDLASPDRGFEVGCVLVDGVNHQVRDRLAVSVPGFAVRQLGRDVLAKEACFVLF